MALSIPWKDVRVAEAREAICRASHEQDWKINLSPFLPLEDIRLAEPRKLVCSAPHEHSRKINLSPFPRSLLVTRYSLLVTRYVISDTIYSLSVYDCCVLTFSIWNTSIYFSHTTFIALCLVDGSTAADGHGLGGF